MINGYEDGLRQQQSVDGQFAPWENPLGRAMRGGSGDAGSPLGKLSNPQPPAPHSLDILLVKLQKIENTIHEVNGTLHTHIDRIAGHQPEACGSESCATPTPEGQLAMLHSKANCLMDLLITTNAQAGRLESI